MSLPALGFWFSPERRRNRKSYIFASLMQMMVLFLLAVLAYPLFLSASESGGILTWLSLAILGVGWVIVSVGTYLTMAQRFRDMNVTGWCALIFLPLQLLSIASLVVELSPAMTISAALGGILTILLVVLLIVWPGTGGDNDYGPDPRRAW